MWGHVWRRGLFRAHAVQVYTSKAGAVTPDGLTGIPAKSDSAEPTPADGSRLRRSIPTPKSSRMGRVGGLLTHEVRLIQTRSLQGLVNEA